jgi:hypothetical protein
MSRTANKVEDHRLRPIDTESLADLYYLVLRMAPQANGCFLYGLDKGAYRNDMTPDEDGPSQGIGAGPDPGAISQRGAGPESPNPNPTITSPQPHQPH